MASSEVLAGHRGEAKLASQGLQVRTHSVFRFVSILTRNHSIGWILIPQLTSCQFMVLVRDEDGTIRKLSKIVASKHATLHSSARFQRFTSSINEIFNCIKYIGTVICSTISLQVLFNCFCKRTLHVSGVQVKNSPRSYELVAWIPFFMWHSLAKAFK